MGKSAKKPPFFNILVIGQAGRLQYEALLFAASLKHSDPGFKGRLIVAEPTGANWQRTTQMSVLVRAELEHLGAEILPFDNVVFGQSYPQGNKIEALTALPRDEPFVFFDTDTLITGKVSEIGFDFDRPAASMNREGTWPRLELYGPGYTEIWRALYDKFELDFNSSLDLSQPDEHWERYLYFNAGWFYYRDPKAFGARFLEFARTIRDDRPDKLVVQPIDPWLDQIALPLVIHSLGGGRPGPELSGLDGDITCHWRVLPLFYATASDAAVDMLETIAAPNRIKKLLKEYEPFKRMIFQGRGRKVRALFDQNDLPAREQAIRQRIKKNGFWMR